jgi:hypothetical protein
MPRKKSLDISRIMSYSGVIPGPRGACAQRGSRGFGGDGVLVGRGERIRTGKAQVKASFGPLNRCGEDKDSRGWFRASSRAAQQPSTIARDAGKPAP